MGYELNIYVGMGVAIPMRRNRQALYRVVEKCLGKIWLACFDVIAELEKGAYLPAMRELSESALVASIDVEDVLIFCVIEPAYWRWTDADLTGSSVVNQKTRSRRNVAAWCNHRDECLRLTEDIRSSNVRKELLISGGYKAWPDLRAEKLGISDKRKLTRLISLVYASDDAPGVFLPNYVLNGRPGGEKTYARSAPGRKPATLECDEKKLPITADLRSLIISHWLARNKKKTVRSAYINFITVHQSTPSVDGKRRDLVDPEKLVSVHQYERIGRAGEEADKKTKNIKAYSFTKDLRTLRKLGKSCINPNNIGMIGVTDSVTHQVTCRSGISYLELGARAVTTLLLDKEIGYIFGYYLSYSPPSAHTASMAILRAMDDIDSYCARLGVELDGREWHRHAFPIVLADNGEMKCSAIFDAAQYAEMSVIFARVFTPLDKSIVESKNQQIHRYVDNEAPAATFGEARVRGDSDPKDDALLTIRQLERRLVEWILKHNHEERVSHMLNIEMERERVPPYRGEILNWAKRKGYFHTADHDLNGFRANALPTMDAVLKSDGVHLLNPYAQEDSIIEGLVYGDHSVMEALKKGGRRRSSVRVKVAIDPSDIRTILLKGSTPLWLELRSGDPLLAETIFAEVCQNDERKRFDRRRARHQDLQRDVNRHHVNLNEEARAEKRLAVASKEESTASQSPPDTGVPQQKPMQYPASQGDERNHVPDKEMDSISHALACLDDLI